MAFPVYAHVPAHELQLVSCIIHGIEESEETCDFVWSDEVSPTRTHVFWWLQQTWPYQYLSIKVILEPTQHVAPLVERDLAFVIAQIHCAFYPSELIEVGDVSDIHHDLPSANAFMLSSSERTFGIL